MSTRRAVRASSVLTAISFSIAGWAFSATIAAADTYLLDDGIRVQGSLIEEYKAPDRATWLRVGTAFGTVDFPKKRLKKRLRARRTKGALRVEGIKISMMKGLVEKSLDGEEWTALSPKPVNERATGEPVINSPNAIVAPGEIVRTGDGEIDLDIGWGVVHVAAQSEIRFAREDETPALSTLHLARGAAGARLDNLPEDGEFRVETPQTSMGVRGTTFAVRLATGTRLAVLEGTVIVANVSVDADSALDVAPDGTTTRGDLDDADRALFARLGRTYAIPRLRRCLVSGGSFTYPLGDPPYDDSGGDQSGWQPIEVTVPPFELSKFEVTNAQYQVFVDFMAEHGDHRFCHPTEENEAHDATLARFEPTTAWYPIAFVEDGQPALRTSWYDAYAFSAWVGGRPPSDSQWEWAALTGDPETVQGDRKLAKLANYAVLFGNARDVDFEGYDGDVPFKPGGAADTTHEWWALERIRTRQVGSLLSDHNGVHDLFGNAAEWVLDAATHTTVAMPRDGRARPTSTFLGPDGQPTPHYVRGWSFGEAARGRMVGSRATINGLHTPGGIRVLFEIRR